MSEFISVADASIAPSELVSVTEKEPFLQFYLEPDTTALLPLQQSAEVISISRKEIVPIFFMPAWVTGVYNLRGEILWVIDLGHLLGLTPCYQQISGGSSLTTIVLNGTPGCATPAKVRNSMLGCLVSQLEAIEYCDSRQIQSSPLTGTPLPFVQGYWSKSEHEKLAILDIAAIMAAMPKPDV